MNKHRLYIFRFLTSVILLGLAATIPVQAGTPRDSLRAPLAGDGEWTQCLDYGMQSRLDGGLLGHRLERELFAEL
jgi:hypothetical protein